MLNRFILLFALMFLVVVPAVSFGSSPALFRDLVIGSRGDDVWVLQKWLNKNGFLLASFGPGSTDLETNYFGSLTQAALLRYQTSVGISPASGNLDLTTRKKIVGNANTVNLPIGCTSNIGFSPLTGIKCDGQVQKQVEKPLENKPIVENTLSTTNLSGFVLPTPPQVSEVMNITSISPSSGSDGTRVTITGFGFDRKDNLVYTGFSEEKVDSIDGNHLTFTLKPGFSLDLDLHLYVVSQSGRSESLLFKLKP